MKLLIAGDSYALFSTPQHPDYANLSVPSTHLGNSFGEIIGEQLSIPVESSAVAGAANPMCAINALRYIIESATSSPVTHCIYHYTQSCRISSNLAGLELSLDINKMSKQEYFKHSTDVFFKTANSAKTLDNIVKHDLIDSDFTAGNLAITDTENFHEYLKKVPIAKIVADNFAYLSLLETCCRNLNIKLMIFSMFVTTNHLFSSRNNICRLNYATQFRPKKTWQDYCELQQKQYGLNLDKIIEIRPGNHLYANEHKELVNDLLTKRINFFR